MAKSLAEEAGIIRGDHITEISKADFTLLPILIAATTDKEGLVYYLKCSDC